MNNNIYLPELAEMSVQYLEQIKQGVTQKIL